MLSILTQIAPLFLIIFLGLLFGLFNKNFDLKLVSSLNRYAYYIGFPSIVIYSFLNTSLNEGSIIESALLNFGILFTLGVFISKSCTQAKNTTHKSKFYFIRTS